MSNGLTSVAGVRLKAGFFFLCLILDTLAWIPLFGRGLSRI